MGNSKWQIRESSLELYVPLHVQPRARRCEIAGLHNGALRLKVIAPPVGDAANRAVIEFFSSLLDIPKSRLHITAGAKSRDKTLLVEGVSLREFLSHFPEPVT